VNSKFKIQTGIQRQHFIDLESVAYLRLPVLVELDGSLPALIAKGLSPFSSVKVGIILSKITRQIYLRSKVVDVS